MPNYNGIVQMKAILLKLIIIKINKLPALYFFINFLNHNE